uniref:Acylneuraminate cytidylyltransferase family protein n=1 Tax=candidate division WOR-3 bacterium TaxID=2052148 RepID=A0A7C3J6N6_UNCW3
MIYALIPAKSESRRIKRKNFIRISGKTLLEFTLDLALESEIFDRIIVSSEKRFAFLKYPSILFDQRPKKLAKDDTKTDELILYLIKKYRMKKDDIIFLLQPTSPLRNIDDLKRSFELFLKKRKTVISVEEIENKGHIYISKNNRIEPLPYGKFFKQNGSIYIFSVRDFLKNKSIPENFQPYLMDRVKSIDIDEYLDYIITLNLI